VLDAMAEDIPRINDVAGLELGETNPFHGRCSG
jgi:hypothetical protein